MSRLVDSAILIFSEVQVVFYWIMMAKELLQKDLLLREAQAAKVAEV